MVSVRENILFAKYKMTLCGVPNWERGGSSINTIPKRKFVQSVVLRVQTGV